MIIGLGTDIVSVDRIAKVLDKNGEQFLRRICLPSERKYVCESSDAKARAAKLWAVKEAAVKALGTGFAQGIAFDEIELIHDDLGKPGVKFHGRAGEILQNLTQGKSVNVFVSLSDDKPFAQAIVILEKI